MRDRLISVFSGIGTVADPPVDPPDWVNVEPDRFAFEALRDAAVLVPIVERADGPTVLLTRRTAHLPRHAGQVAFPGGGQEPGDASPEETALRETEEEIGLGRDRIELIGRLKPRVSYSGFLVVPIVGLVRPPFALRPDPNEVDAVFEVPLDYVLDRDNHTLESHIRDGRERTFHVLPYGEHQVWGFTAMLLVNLADTIGWK